MGIAWVSLWEAERGYFKDTSRSQAPEGKGVVGSLETVWRSNRLMDKNINSSPHGATFAKCSQWWLGLNLFQRIFSQVTKVINTHYNKSKDVYIGVEVCVCVCIKQCSFQTYSPQITSVNSLLCIFLLHPTPSFSLSLSSSMSVCLSLTSTYLLCINTYSLWWRVLILWKYYHPCINLSETSGSQYIWQSYFVFNSSVVVHNMDIL